MTRTDCGQFESLLARAADEALDEADRARLDAHLSGCAECRGALADQLAVRQALQSRPALRAQPDFAVRVMQVIDAEQRPWLGWLDFRQWTWRLAPVAAALLVAALAVVQLAPASSETASGVTADAAFDSTLPVSAALWQESMTDTSVLSLMLRASADDRLADAYKER